MDKITKPCAVALLIMNSYYDYFDLHSTAINIWQSTAIRLCVIICEPQQLVFYPHFLELYCIIFLVFSQPWRSCVLVGLRVSNRCFLFFGLVSLAWWHAALSCDPFDFFEQSCCEPNHLLAPWASTVTSECAQTLIQKRSLSCYYFVYRSID